MSIRNCLGCFETLRREGSKARCLGGAKHGDVSDVGWQVTAFRYYEKRKGYQKDTKSLTEIPAKLLNLSVQGAELRCQG